MTKTGLDTTGTDVHGPVREMVNDVETSEPVATAATLFMLHAYSPQIYGPKWRSSGEAIEANRWRVIYEVVCPYGTNNDNAGQVISGDTGKRLSGTINPEDQDCFWYGAGVTDQIDSAVNFI